MSSSLWIQGSDLESSNSWAERRPGPKNLQKHQQASAVGFALPPRAGRPCFSGQIFFCLDFLFLAKRQQLVL